MTRPVVLRPDADVQAIHDDLERAQPGLGGRFVARLRDLLARIETAPTMYGPVWQDVRAARVRRFRHVVYFVVFADRVEVLAVMHGGRDPGAWQARA